MQRAMCVRRKATRVATALGAVVLLGICTTRAESQTRATGHIVDATDRTPIPNAQVIVTGTTIGGVANDSGRFAITLPADAKSLTVRRIGFLGKVVPVSPGPDGLHRHPRPRRASPRGGGRDGRRDDCIDARVRPMPSRWSLRPAVNEVPAPTVENAIQGQVPGAVISAKQRRRAGWRHADPDPRHDVDLRECVAALRRRWRHHRQ